MSDTATGGGARQVNAHSSRAPLTERAFSRSPALRWSAVAVVVAFVCAVLFLAAEGVVRIRHYARHGDFWRIEDTYRFDSDIGLRVLIPDSRFGRVTINHQGFRGPEITLPKPVGTIRIAFLGASTTYCAEVSSDERTWPHLVTQMLKDSFPGVPFDYVNAGVPGYGIDSILRNFDRRVLPLQPDVVVIYEATNDLTSNSFKLARSRGLAVEHPEERMGWLSRHSLLVYLVRKNFHVVQAERAASRQTGKLEFHPEELAAPFRNELGELVRSVRSAGPMTFIATFAPRVRNTQSVAERAAAVSSNLYYMPFLTADGILSGYETYNVVIREIAQREGIELIGDEDAIPGDAEHYVDSVHFSDAGSTAMAHRVAGAMARSEAFRSLVERRRAGAEEVG